MVAFEPGQRGFLVFDGKAYEVEVVGYLPSKQYIVAVVPPKEEK